MSKMKSVHVNVDHTYTIMIVILDNEIDGGHDYSHLSISVLKCGPALWFFNKKKYPAHFSVTISDHLFKKVISGPLIYFYFRPVKGRSIDSAVSLTRFAPARTCRTRRTCWSLSTALSSTQRACTRESESGMSFTVSQNVYPCILLHIYGF